MSNRIDFELNVKTEKAQVQATKASRSIGRTFTDFNKSFGKRITSAISAPFLGAFRMITSTAGKLIGTLGTLFAGRALIRAAMQQQDAINSLNSSLQITGQFSEATSRSLQEFASEMQKTTKFGDELTMQNMALIQSLGRLDEEGLKRATVAAQDMASALGVDLATASRLVGRAATGNISVLTRYGLEVQKGATNAESFANALQAIETQFGGAAQAQAATFSGRLAQMRNNFGDLLEVLGDTIIRSNTMIHVVGGLSNIFDDLRSRFMAFTEGRDLIHEMVMATIGFARAVNLYLVVPIELAVELISGAFRRLISLISGIVLRIGELVTGIAERVLAFGGIFTSKFDDMRRSVEGLNEVLGLARDAAFEDAFSAPALDFSTAAMIDGTLDSFEEFMNEIEPGMSDAMKGFGSGLAGAIGEGIEDNLGAIGRSTATIGQVFQQSIQGGFINSMQNLGAAFVSAGNGFDQFGKSMLGVLGDLAIQIGSFLVTAGLGFAALPLGFSGLAAVAAGGALIAIGGALKALSGGAGAGSATTIQSGGRATTAVSTGGGGLGLDPTFGALAEDRDRELQGTQVNLTVQGNILDRRETGLELAEIIQDSFNREGTAIVRGAV